MSVFEHMLTKAELKFLSDAYKTLGSDKLLRRRISVELEDYVREIDSSQKILPHTMRRVLLGELPADPCLKALMYDYLAEVLSINIKKITISDEQNRKPSVQAIRNVINARLIKSKTASNPFIQMAKDLMNSDYETTVPSIFRNTFFGYRRGSRDGEIIRFYMRIIGATSSSNFVSFTNIYNIGPNNWIVKGSGVFTKNTLYLFGHARSKETREGLGYRVLALRQLGAKTVLHGVVISMDTAGPIAAKVVLIPKENHDFSEENIEKYNIPDQSSLTHNEWIYKYLKEPKDYFDPKYMEGLQAQTLQNFAEVKPYGLLYYISNFSLDVLKCDQTYDDIIIRKELDFRNLMIDNRVSPSARIREALEALIYAPQG